MNVQLKQVVPAVMGTDEIKNHSFADSAHKPAQRSVRSNKIQHREVFRAQAMKQLGISSDPPDEGYGTMGLGVLLIMLGFLIKSFLVTGVILSTLPYGAMLVGFSLSVKHFVTAA